MNTLPVSGIKLQLLHVLKGTDLAEDYLKKQFQVMSKEEYLDLVITCIRHLRPDIVIHRLTGDGPRDLLLAPLWSSAKRSVLNDLHHQMSVRGIRQGDLYRITLKPLPLQLQNIQAIAKLFRSWFRVPQSPCKISYKRSVTC